MVGKIDLQKGKNDDAERFALRVNFFIGNNRPLHNLVTWCKITHGTSKE